MYEGLCLAKKSLRPCRTWCMFYLCRFDHRRILFRYIHIKRTIYESMQLCIYLCNYIKDVFAWCGKYCLLGCCFRVYWVKCKWFFIIILFNYKYVYVYIHVYICICICYEIKYLLIKVFDVLSINSIDVDVSCFASSSDNGRMRICTFTLSIILNY